MAQAPLSDLDLMRLSHQICSVWMNMGTWLGLPTHALNNIAGTTHLDTPQKKAFEMLIMWRQRQASPSREALACALIQEGREDLASQVFPCQQTMSDEHHPIEEQANRSVKQEMAIGAAHLHNASPSQHRQRQQPSQQANSVVPPPDDVVFLVRTADDVTAIKQAMEHLRLNEATLMELSADTRRRVRGLANQLKSVGRLDAVRHLRTLVLCGTTGPLLNESLPLSQMPQDIRQDLTRFLSGGEEWKLVASEVGLSGDNIRFFNVRYPNPADKVLDELVELRKKRKEPQCTVGQLYDILVKCELPAAADRL